VIPAVWTGYWQRNTTSHLDVQGILNILYSEAVAVYLETVKYCSK
jgi:hypothetical protein